MTTAAAAAPNRRARQAWIADHDWRLTIANAPASTAEAMSISEPAVGRLLTRVPVAGAQEVDAVVTAARRAVPGWRRTPVKERAQTLRDMAAILETHGEELAEIDALDAGHPLAAMRIDVQLAISALTTYADWGHGLDGDAVALGGDYLHYTVREPFGLVARIVPFNHPLLFSATKLALPLLAGNAVVLKAPDQAPLSALRLGELFKNVIPPGLLSVLSGPGDSTGEALVAHPDIRRIAFIGSDATGRAIQRRAAEVAVKTVTLELGGKNPMIALPDADPAIVAAGALAGMNFRMTAGQSCGSTSRLLLPTALLDEILERLRHGATALQIGDPLDRDTEMGCLITPQHRDRVARMVRNATHQGARIVAGGEEASQLGGAFYPPTVLDGVTPDSEMGQSEVFGPVLSVMTYTDEADLLAIANGTRFGLTASVWTPDVARAHALARELDAGYIWINSSSRHFEGTPFGGMKDSGVGSEESLDELRSYTQIKSVHTLLPRLITHTSAEGQE